MIVMKTILLAEDNADMVELIQLILNQSGFKILTAADGNEAVSMALGNNPDLLLLDINMPGMDGISVTASLREQGFENPIIILTGSESDEDRQRAEQAGCNDYILKTMNMDGVETVLNSYLLRGE